MAEGNRGRGGKRIQYLNITRKEKKVKKEFALMKSALIVMMIMMNVHSRTLTLLQVVSLLRKEGVLSSKTFSNLYFTSVLVVCFLLIVYEVLIKSLITHLRRRKRIRAN